MQFALSFCLALAAGAVSPCLAADLSAGGVHLQTEFQFGALDAGSPERAVISETVTPWDGQISEDLLERMGTLRASGAEPVLFLEIEGEPDRRTEKLKSALLARQVPIEVLSFPRAQAALIRESMKKLGRTVGEAYLKPSREEVALGVVSTVYRFASSATIWLATPGVSFELAAGITAFSTTVTALFAIYGRTLENLFWTRFGSSGQRVGSAEFSTRRMIFNLLCGAIPSLAQNGHAEGALAGHLRALVNTVVTAAGDTWLSKLRRKVFMGGGSDERSERTFSRFGFLTFLLMAPIGLLDFAGSWGSVIFRAGSFEFRTTTALVLGIYAAAIAALKTAPGTMKTLCLLPEKLLGRRETPAPCRQLLLPLS